MGGNLDEKESKQILIDNLKKQVDNIYFGNLLPIIKLQNISNNYKEIITCRSAKYSCDIKKEEYAILEEWKYYNEAYKETKSQETIQKEVILAIEKLKMNGFVANLFCCKAL